MTEFGKYFLLYGYLLPTWIVILWIQWNFYTNPRFKLHSKGLLLLLIPGVSLFSASILLAFLISEASYWLEIHWELWREAGERGRDIMRRLFNVKKKLSMTQEEYIKAYPQQFKDELDKWLFKEFDIIGGPCSSIESMKYDVAKEVAEKAMEYAKKQIIKDSVECDVLDDGKDLITTESWEEMSNLLRKIGIKGGDKVRLAIFKVD